MYSVFYSLQYGVMRGDVEVENTIIEVYISKRTNNITKADHYLG